MINFLLAAKDITYSGGVMDYLLPVLAALLTFFSGCVLPMLPVFISYFTAGQSSWRRTLVNASGFTLGMTVILVALMMMIVGVATLFGNFMVNFGWLVNLITGAIVILFGLSFVGMIKIPFLSNSINIKVKTDNMKFLSAILFGLVYALSFGPCAWGSISAVIGNALTDVIKYGYIFKAIIMMLMYSLSLGVLFIGSALLVNRLKGAFKWMQRNQNIINIVSGSILIILGILMVTGIMNMITAL